MSILHSEPESRVAKRRKVSHSSEKSKAEKLDLSEEGSSYSSNSAESESEANEEPESRPLRASAAVGQGSAARNGGFHGSQSRSIPLTSHSPSPAGLGKSAMMSLQVNELLSEVRRNYERQISHLEKTLSRLKDIINALPPSSPMRALDAEELLKKESAVSIPFPQPRPGKETKYAFEYQQPAALHVAGSFALKLDIKGHNTADMVVTMPKALFQDKDYLNYRAFHKRAYYLARIAAGIKDAADSEFILEYEEQDGIPLVPVIVVRPTESSPEGFTQSKYRIRLQVAIPKQAFPLEKLLPTKNCVRPPASSTMLSHLDSTPFYNSCLCETMSLSTYHSTCEWALQECESFRNVCLLGHVWLRQLGLGSELAKGGFGAFDWTILCALLLRRGGARGRPALSSRYNTLQLFKAVLQFLAARDLSEPMLLDTSVEVPKSNSPILFDGTTGVNLFFKMTPWSYHVLRHEASSSLSALNARSQDNFDATFIMRSSNPILKFDQLLQLDLPSTIDARGKLEDLKVVQYRLYKVLTQGLGDRVKIMSLYNCASTAWPLNKSEARLGRDDRCTNVGLLLNSDNADRLVDRGPVAEDREGTVKFRVFWGEKSELRRFRDGIICESLVWSEDRPVIQQIVEHLLQRHFSITSEEIKTHGDKYNSLSSPSRRTLQPVAVFKMLNDAFQTLTSQLRQLEGLPLSIRSIVPADAQFRSSPLHCPLISSPATPANVLIQFEGSARWPDSLPAIQHTKIAFLAKLADVLSAAHPEIKTRLGLENTSTATSGHLNTSFLDIVYPPPSPGLTPIPFRLRIHHDREQTLLEKALADKDLHGSTRDTLASALATYRRNNLASPRHTTALQNLCTRFPTLSPTIHLLKKWTSAHLLSSNHIRNELLELIAAKVFLQPYPWSVPATAQTAFLRALVSISRWEWAAEPLIVDLSGNDEMTSEEIAAMTTRFEAWRKIDPAMNNVVMFAASNIEPTGVVWTQAAKPPRVVALRLTALAKASVELIRSKELEMGDEDWMALFKSPLTDFDFLIHLNESVVRVGGRREVEKKAKYKNLVMQEETDMDHIGFDAVELFLEDLEYVLGQNVLFFYNADGGRVIAGLWNPRSLGTKTWRVRMGYSSMPVAAGKGGEGGKDQVVINQLGILAEIAMLGEGMVDKVEVVKNLVQ